MQTTKGNGAALDEERFLANPNSFLEAKKEELREKFAFSEKLLRKKGFYVTYYTWWENDTDPECKSDADDTVKILDTYPAEGAVCVRGYAEIRIFKTADTSDENKAICETFRFVDEGRVSGENVDSTDGNSLSIAVGDADFISKNPKNGFRAVQKKKSAEFKSLVKKVIVQTYAEEKQKGTAARSGLFLLRYSKVILIVAGILAAASLIVYLLKLFNVV